MPASEWYTRVSIPPQPLSPPLLDKIDFLRWRGCRGVCGCGVWNDISSQNNKPFRSYNECEDPSRIDVESQMGPIVCVTQLEHRCTGNVGCEGNCISILLMRTNKDRKMLFPCHRFQMRANRNSNNKTEYKLIEQ